MSRPGSVESLLDRVRDWWRRQNELGGLGSHELGRVAQELGMSAGALEDVVARGRDAASHVYERMQALGLSQAEVEHAAMDVLRDLQRTCACCNEKGRCEKDLRDHPTDPVWRAYCPNAATLDSLTKLKDRCMTQ